jgi:predicted DCC family thiol-disulfide oxidoreductase YuxK
MSAVLLYDGECGLCRAAVRGARALARRGSIKPIAAQSEKGRALTPGMSDAQRMASFHLVENGKVVSGPDALAPTIRHLRGLAPAAGVLERRGVVYRAAAATYHWITPRRRSLSRFLPNRWKQPLPES